MKNKPENIKIKLPEDFDKSKTWEDYVSAYYKKQGFVSFNNIEIKEDLDSKSSELGEIDILAIKFKGKTLDKTLIEVKSGKNVKISDLVFKLKGQSIYLNIPNISLYVSNQISLESKHKKIAENLQVGLYQFDINSHKTPEESAYVYHNKVERLFIKIMNDRKGDQKFTQLLQYYKKIGNNLFLEKPESSLKQMYSSFKEGMYLTRRTCQSIFGENSKIVVLEKYSEVEKQVYDYIENKELTNKEFLDSFEKLVNIWIAEFIEHKSRYNLLNFLMIYAIEFKPDLYNFLPENFKKAITNLKEDNNSFLLPYFWQVFYELLGGFIIIDPKYKDSELYLINKLTGIDKDKIEKYLLQYNNIFSSRKETDFFEKKCNSKILALKYYPEPFKGLGAYYRKLSNSAKNYSDIYEGEIAEELKKYNNLTLTFFKQEEDIRKKC
ncbi:MAG TPA: hypothetical protein PK103_03325 [Elusimicrobiales bacterium]|nr:hypothetical protein [Elusimicrobiales bacterium]HOL62383.1 hypothetical protein [Elusimicrobiales bacterium]